jgi:hypothetical protein
MWLRCGSELGCSPAPGRAALAETLKRHNGPGELPKVYCWTFATCETPAARCSAQRIT